MSEWEKQEEREKAAGVRTDHFRRVHRHLSFSRLPALHNNPMAHQRLSSKKAEEIDALQQRLAAVVAAKALVSGAAGENATTAVQGEKGCSASGRDASGSTAVPVEGQSCVPCTKAGKICVMPAGVGGRACARCAKAGYRCGAEDDRPPAQARGISDFPSRPGGGQVLAALMSPDVAEVEALIIAIRSYADQQAAHSAAQHARLCEAVDCMRRIAAATQATNSVMLDFVEAYSAEAQYPRLRPPPFRVCKNRERKTGDAGGGLRNTGGNAPSPGNNGLL
ncbi:hypothetical protein HYDPIDRAFT_28324 [Hydnomerulius pinastri MD-312]|uniref:Uncharacterized protein n=1 Tax=Hydnomerulius pinastri MD-312 TaxID=994086 RepID=A0A0C9VH81_9AGAM|nr:hypothetical protein HYDPIDRAFT_28324 [Hydnomerulius pinastri MD-312]